MKHSIVVKFFAILLSTCALLAAVAGGASIVAIEAAGLYVGSLDELQEQQYETIASDVAYDYAEFYAVEQLSNMSYTMRYERYSDPENRGDSEYWTVRLQQGDKLLVEAEDTAGYDRRMEYTVTPMYPIVSLSGPEENSASYDQEDPTAVTSPTLAVEGARSSVFYDDEVPEDYLFYSSETVWENGGLITYYFYYFEAPEYTVTVYMQPEVLESSSLHILTALYPLRYSAIAVLMVGILVFAVGMVYLCWSAGKTKNGEIRPGGLNWLPLDLYAGGVLVAGALLIVLFGELCDWVIDEGPHPGNLSLLAINLSAIILLGIGFLFAFAAQIKVKGGYWWHHSVIGFCVGKIGQGIRFAVKGIRAVFRMLPVIWQWLLIAAGMAFVLLITFLLAAGNSYFRFNEFFLIVLLLEIVMCVVIVCYGGYCLGTLLVGARKMSKGNLSHKIPTKYLYGSFRDFAEQLNDLSEVAMLSAKQQMKSERMKTELITNVSHDIKTPLTSIINFVDLLRKPHTAEEEQQYLDVLARQSDRMKRLIEDLMDLSKASTGNMSVNITRIDAAEAVNQALGEFADKLESAKLTPVFRQPENQVMIQADGRLVWRVLSNLLSNAVKYAMPGTRLYVDLIETEDQTILSIKNISRAELNTSAEELMERFVQGDVSRNTEGSGLGLNIAQSLMEVQHGKLQLTLDGDLFKVTLVFPSAG